mmetsp:Transcript_68086/g.160175  ORF Transcript_68086/g.160175 Transcript_68086/m.160175 type:complete len:92 (-) Transcript_68086:146-421(-)
MSTLWLPTLATFVGWTHDCPAPFDRFHFTTICNLLELDITAQRHFLSSSLPSRLDVRGLFLAQSELRFLDVLRFTFIVFRLSNFHNFICIC